MQNLTLTVGLAAALLILVLRPLYGLGIYFVVLFLYPHYLTVQVFGCNFSAQRIALVALLFRVVIDGDLVERFKLNLLDKLVVAMAVIGFLTLSMTMNASDFAKTYSGHIMDSVLVYFAVRLTVVDGQTLLKVVKIVSVLLFVSAVIGVIQSVTGISPYDGLYAYCPWNLNGNLVAMNQRVGFYRACGSFAVHIMFGLSFVTFLPLILLLRYERGVPNAVVYILFTAAVFGALSSVSAGPYLGILAILACLVLKHQRWRIKMVLIGLALMVAGIEIVSNRGFFYAVSRFAFDEGNAWYRARLIDVAVMKLPEYWMFGYGLVDPGWGPSINALPRTDMCNQYVLQAASYGLGGLAILVFLLWTSLAGLRRRAILYTDRLSKDIAWMIGIAIVALVVVFWSVGVFGKFTSVFYSLLGMAGCFYVPKVNAKSAYFTTTALGRQEYC